MIIKPYDSTMRQIFEEMLVTYFLTDLQSDIPEDILRGKLLDLIISNAEKRIYHLSIAFEGGAPIGFSIYQIDTPDSDWCKRPGWGFIREFYISAPYRRKGYGTKLAAFSEKQLRALGAEHLYLTSDGAAAFWESCGFSNSHELCSNELEILTK